MQAHNKINTDKKITQFTAIGGSEINWYTHKLMWFYKARPLQEPFGKIIRRSINFILFLAETMYLFVKVMITIILLYKGLTPIILAKKKPGNSYCPAFLLLELLLQFLFFRFIPLFTSIGSSES
jgi:hypothetical protein